MLSVFGTVTSAPINSASKASMGKMGDRIDELKRDIIDGREASKEFGVPFTQPDYLYGIQVDFDQFDIADESQSRLRHAVKNIATSWTIDAAARASIRQAAEILLTQHPCFQALKKQLHVTFDIPEVESRMAALRDQSDLCGADVGAQQNP